MPLEFLLTCMALGVSYFGLGYALYLKRRSKFQSLAKARSHEMVSSDLAVTPVAVYVSDVLRRLHTYGDHHFPIRREDDLNETYDLSVDDLQDFVDRALREIPAKHPELRGGRSGLHPNITTVGDLVDYLEARLELADSQLQ
jgi:hypothetical protein